MISLDDLFLKCPYATSQKILSGKWALMILNNLSDGPVRFNELQRQLPEMTQTTLTRQLRTLEDYGVISRKVYAQIPPKVEYDLSEIGREFIPVLDALKLWGESYIAKHQEIEAIDA